MASWFSSKQVNHDRLFQTPFTFLLLCNTGTNTSTKATPKTLHCRVENGNVFSWRAFDDRRHFSQQPYRLALRKNGNEQNDKNAQENKQLFCPSKISNFALSIGIEKQCKPEQQKRNWITQFPNLILNLNLVLLGMKWRGGPFYSVAHNFSFSSKSFVSNISNFVEWKMSSCNSMNAVYFKYQNTWLFHCYASSLREP